MDIDAPRKRGISATPLNVTLGMTLTHQGTRTTGRVVRYVQGQQIIIRDQHGRDHTFRPQDGAFSHEGAIVALRKLVAADDGEVRFTASGSIDVGHVPARIARASRIYVEGIHDAELIEKVWGDDLRIEGIVVEQMEGADDLAQLVRTFQPGPRRRLGVLLGQRRLAQSYLQQGRLVILSEQLKCAAFEVPRIIDRLVLFTAPKIAFMCSPSSDLPMPKCFDTSTMA